MTKVDLPSPGQTVLDRQHWTPNEEYICSDNSKYESLRDNLSLGCLNTSFTAVVDCKSRGKRHKTHITFSSEKLPTFQTCRKTFFQLVPQTHCLGQSVPVTDLTDLTCFTTNGWDESSTLSIQVLNEKWAQHSFLVFVLL